MQDTLSNQFYSILRKLIREEIELYIQKQVTYTFKTPRSPLAQPLIAGIFGWRKPDEKLLMLHLELISRGFINCPFEKFQSIFLGNPEPLNWLSSLKNLVYIFDQLTIIEAIHKKENFHILLSQNFLNKYGRKLKIDSLKSTLSRVRDGRIDKDLELLVSVCK